MYKNGAKVIISARNEDMLAHVAEKARSVTADSSASDGGAMTVLPLDVTASSDLIDSAVVKALNIYGGVDILILNAGRTQRSVALSTSEDSTRELLELNFMSPVRLAMALIRHDRWEEQKRGHIVVTSSVAGKYAVALSSSYAASKHAAQGYFSSLRSENPWLRVDLVCPGPIATPIARSAVSTKPLPTDEESESKMPVDRCARLIMSSIVGPEGLFYETWIAQNPVLVFSYLNQYAPSLFTALINKVGSIRVKAFNEGKNMYKLSSLLEVARSDKDTQD
uniref:NAD(P)-binding protein n=1 Tax=Leptocylindrus danicus TaxID=163516 RepID=A0A7S2LBS9_9STRA